MTPGMTLGLYLGLVIGFSIIIGIKITLSIFLIRTRPKYTVGYIFAGSTVITVIFFLIPACTGLLRSLK